MYAGAATRQDIRVRCAQGDLDVAANYERLAVETRDVRVRIFFLEQARVCRDAARAEMERMQCPS